MDWQKHPGLIPHMNVEFPVFHVNYLIYAYYMYIVKAWMFFGIPKRLR